VLSFSAVRQALREAALRAIDVMRAIVGLLGTLPFFVVLPILIKIDSPGPAFYKQIRTGLGRNRKQRNGRQTDAGADGQNAGEKQVQDFRGRPFYIYKFRTMRNGAEKNGPVWAQKNDPRVTRVGKWLRKAHLDEIPQFFNVLKGEMSLVGPRPERPEIIATLIKKHPEYQQRLAVKPGITGVLIRKSFSTQRLQTDGSTIVSAMKIRIKRPVAKGLRVMAILLFLFHGQSAVLAQRNDNGVMINSNPTGAMVTLKGEYEFVGRTPFFLPYPLTGQYQIKATKSGFESKAKDHIFSPSNGRFFEITLARKTPAKAFYRSLMLPGWGHFYAGRKTWGVFYSGIVATSFAAAAVNQSRYRDAQSAYEDAYARFNNTQAAFAEQNQAFQDMNRLSRDLEDHKKQRDRSLYFAGGIWLISIVENLIFFPSFSHEIGSTQEFSPSLMPAGDGAILHVQIPIN
jgi:lipopolysaccharide/colanic/teichoic acid biosynthesis glycosyltransferase